MPALPLFRYPTHPYNQSRKKAVRSMEEDIKTLSDYVSIAWRRKLHILIPFALVLSITAVTTFVLPPVYKSTGTILIESQQIPQELIQSTVTSFANERIQIIKQRIMTSQQLFGIIRKFDLYQDEIDTNPRSEILEDMRNRVSINQVSANVRSRRRGSSALIAFTVSFEHNNPGIAQKVANELVTLFLDENIKTRTARAEETTEFLKKESERLGAQIADMEANIAAYKQENEGSLPETLNLNLERVVSLKNALLNSETELSQLYERRKLLLIDLDTAQSRPEAGLSDDEQQQKQELKNLQNQFISLSARYGTGHPDVKSVKRQLEAFEREYGNLSNMEDLRAQQEQARKELFDLKKKYSDEHPDIKKAERRLEGIETMIAEFEEPVTDNKEEEANPLVLQINARLESVDNSISRIKANQLNLEKQIVLLDERITKTPQVERGLEALVRDYQNTKSKYQEMKAKELQAELSKSLEEEQKGERFTLLEPPLLPDKPVKPNRPMIFMVGLMLSFVGGIGVAGVAESLDGGIRGPRALASVTKATPLVSIPFISTREDEVSRRRNFKIIVAVLVVLVIGFAAAVHFFYKPLDLLWYIVLRKLNLT